VKVKRYVAVVLGGILGMLYFIIYD